MTGIEVKVIDETVWLTQQQMAELFQTSRTNVVEHIKDIYEEGELDESSTCQDFRQVRLKGVTQGISTGIYACIQSIFFGLVYMILKQDIKFSYIAITFMFML